MALLQCDICGGKLTGRAGGIYECEFCGMQYDTSWAKAKIQEIKGTVKVEGTVQVAGTVKVDGPVKVEGSASKESLLKRAQLALEDRSWKSAAEYFEKALDIDPECAEAYFGLAMCEAEANTLEALVNAEKWDNKNYIKGKRFASGALLAQVEQLEQAYLQRKREEAEKEREERIAREKREEEERIAREKRKEEDRIAREERKRRLKPIRDRLQKAAYLMEAGSNHTVGLKSDGTVVSTDSSKVGNWRDIVQVSAGASHTVGLKADGIVMATRYKVEYYYGQCNVSSWRDIVQVSAGYSHTVGLKADGTVVAVGDNDCGQCDVNDWRDIVQVSAGERHTVGLKADGTVVAVGNDCDGRCNVKSWRDIVQVNAGSKYTVGLKADGTLVVVGDNDHGQCNVIDWRLFQHLDTLEQERIDARNAVKKREEEKRIARERRKEEAERIALERRKAGLCQHCGGGFKGLFKRVCTACGKPKDY